MYIIAMLTMQVICRKQPTRWSEVAGSSTLDIMTTQCKAYKLVTIRQDREVVSEHEYDEIPAFVGGRQIQGQKDYKDIPVQPPVPTLQATCGEWGRHDPHISQCVIVY